MMESVGEQGILKFEDKKTAAIANIMKDRLDSSFELGLVAGCGSGQRVQLEGFVQPGVQEDRRGDAECVRQANGQRDLVQWVWIEPSTAG